ncbi:MAG: hypothetical protein HN576_07220 [Bacteriovoracaceae bacterium]|nr:hypothetical protein [Bacteriovoracaceae bacterium]
MEGFYYNLDKVTEVGNLTTFHPIRTHEIVLFADKAVDATSGATKLHKLEKHYPKINGLKGGMLTYMRLILNSWEEIRPHWNITRKRVGNKV